MVIMTKRGNIIQVNDAFTNAFGYTNEDLQSKNFRMLFKEEDQLRQRPEIEINITLREGSTNDENYVIRKDGTPVWVTGECILVQADDYTFIVKIIHTLHAQEQLDRYLLASSELLTNLFDSVHESGLLLLDGQLRLRKMNAAFRKIFALSQPVSEGCKVGEIGHPLWQDASLRTIMRDVIVSNKCIMKQLFSLIEDESVRHLEISSKLMISEKTYEKELLLVVKEL